MNCIANKANIEYRENGITIPSRQSSSRRRWSDHKYTIRRNLHRGWVSQLVQPRKTQMIYTNTFCMRSPACFLTHKSKIPRFRPDDSRHSELVQMNQYKTVSAERHKNSRIMNVLHLNARPVLLALSLAGEAKSCQAARLAQVVGSWCRHTHCHLRAGQLVCVDHPSSLHRPCALAGAP